MLDFDFVGDAVWLLGWRKFEREHFTRPKEMTGWHRNMRCHVTTSNNFMAEVARRLGLESHTGDEKGYADALEDMVGKLELESPGAGVVKVMELFSLHLNIPRLRIKTSERVDARKHRRFIDFTAPNERANTFLVDPLKSVLGEFF